MEHSAVCRDSHITGAADREALKERKVSASSSSNSSNSSGNVVPSVCVNATRAAVAAIEAANAAAKFHLEREQAGPGAEGIVPGGKRQQKQQQKMRDGHGVYVWPTGDSYEGYWKDGKMHCKGTFRWDNGDVYDGDWLDGKMTGKGRKTMANGDVYDGVSMCERLIHACLLMSEVVAGVARRQSSRPWRQNLPERRPT